MKEEQIYVTSNRAIIADLATKMFENNFTKFHTLMSSIVELLDDIADIGSAYDDCGNEAKRVATIETMGYKLDSLFPFISILMTYYKPFLLDIHQQIPISHPESVPDELRDHVNKFRNEMKGTEEQKSVSILRVPQ